MASKKDDKPKGVNVTIPSGPVGRAIDVVTDMFRPFSEARGLKADQIRLQREDVLIEVAKRARERLAIEEGDLAPVPNKVLVPLIEAASNEDISDKYMIERWADLLASATKEGLVEPRFVSLLKELSGRQAKLLCELVRWQWERYPNPKMVLRDCPYKMEPASFGLKAERIISDYQAKKITTADLPKVVANYVNRPGCIAFDIYRIGPGVEYIPLDNKYTIDMATRAVDPDILTSLDLCQKGDVCS